MEIRTLILDIEVLPATVLAYDLRTTYINKEMILKPRRTVLVCAKWAGEPEVFTFAEWHRGGHKKMLRDIWALMDEAHSIVTWNGDAYDLKELATEFIQAGMDAPSPFVSTDLFKAAKRKFRFMSASLLFVADTLNTGHQKLDSGGIALVKRLMDGDKQARADYELYCRGDVLATEELLERLKNYLPPSMVPNAALFSGNPDACRYCGSLNIIRKGKQYTATSVFQRFFCKDCGKYHRGVTRLATCELRPVA